MTDAQVKYAQASMLYQEASYRYGEMVNKKYKHQLNHLDQHDSLKADRLRAWLRKRSGLTKAEQLLAEAEEELRLETAGA